MDILAIQEIFKNHRKIFGSLQDNLGLVKLQESFLGLMAILETFKNDRKIIGSLQDITAVVKLHESYLGPSDSPEDDF